MADPAAEAVLTRNYQPYGQELNSSGAAATPYGFTGEWTDQTGLVHLRTRYYDPGQGRFITKDVWQGKSHQPMSYNNWLYVYASPLVYVDPSGYQGECPGCIPEPPSHPPTPPEPKETPDADTIRRQYEEKIDNDHRNLPYWLINAMERNAHSLEVNEIRLHNQRGSLSVLKAFLVQKDLKCLPRVAMEKILAYSKWYSLVDGGARWDFKNRIYNELGEDIRLCGLFGCNWYKWDVPAKIHYGYVGKAAGFKDIELHCGAGYAQKVGIASEEGRF